MTQIRPAIATGQMMKRARKCLQKRQIRAVAFVAFDAMVHRCRTPWQTGLMVPYARLGALIGYATEATVEAVKQLIAAGLITKHKHWRLVEWGPAGQGGKQWCQMANEYRLVWKAPEPDCDFVPRRTDRKLRTSKRLWGVKIDPSTPVFTEAERFAALLDPD